MITTRRLVPYLLILLLFLRCSVRPDQEAHQETLNAGFCFPARIEELNPVSGNSAVCPVMDLLFDALVSTNESLVVVPEVAESWEVSDDGLTYTFHLRRGVLFHDGVECTADDVKFSLDLVLDPRTEYPSQSALHQVERVEAVDAYTVTFRLKEPYTPVLATLGAPILPKHLLEGTGKPGTEFCRHPIGTGPFKLLRRESQNRFVFVANRDYFKGPPGLDRIVVTLFDDHRALGVSLVKGDTEVACSLPPDVISIIENDTRLKVYEGEKNMYYVLQYNLRSPVFSDREVRVAVSCGISRDQLIKEALAGRGVPATGPFLPGTWPCDPDIPATPYDPDKSLSLLKQAGWTDADGDGFLEREGKPLEFTLVMDSTKKMKRNAAGIMRLQLEEIGIRMKAEAVPYDLLMERIRAGRFDACFVELNPGADPDAASYLWHSKGPYSFGAYSNEQVDALLDSGRVARSARERQQIYHRVQALLVEDHPAAFLFIPKYFSACTSRLKGAENLATVSLFYRVEKWHLASQGEMDAGD